LAQEVLYRKWRPRRFGDVAGQDPVITTLRNAVGHGTPAHAYLFAGPRGTGKTTTGRILAKAVNCPTTEGGEPCDHCQSCTSYDEGRAIDLIELDAASNRGIDEIRDLRESAGYSPAAGRYKVYLIDEVHMLTDAAFNALLKTLEEPPPHVIFILATTEQHKIPATILSRCQRFDLRRIPLDAVVGRLETICAGEGITVAPGGLELIARQATGALRDAINLLDQLVAYHGHTLDLEQVRSGLGLVVDDRAAGLAKAAIQRDLKAGLTLLAGARDDGVEIRGFVKTVVTVLRQILLLKAGAEDQLGLSDAQAEELNNVASTAQVTEIVAALQAFGDLDFAGDAYDALPVEIAFATLATGLAVGGAGPAAAPSMPAVAPRTAPGRPAAPQRSAPAQRQEVPAARQAPAQRQAPAAAEEAPARQFAPPDEGQVSDELSTLRQKWPDVQALARKKDVRAGAFLSSPSSAFPKALEGDRVTVGFLFPAHRDKVQGTPEVHAALRDAVSEVLGRALQVDLIEWPELASAGTAAPTKSAGGHLVEEALKQGARRIDG